MRSISYFTLIFLILWGCSNSPKKGNISVKKNNSGIKIFVNEKINLDSCTIIEEIDNRSNFSIIRKDRKYGLINNNKQLVLPIEFDTIERPHLADYFFISKNRLYGVVTYNGTLTVPLLYEHIEYDWKEQKSEEEDCFIVQKNKKLGSIDFYNNTIIPIEFDGISNWVEYGPNAHYVKKGSQYGMVDYNTGRMIIPVEYDGIVDHRGLIEIKKNKQYGILNWKNDVIIPCIYDKIYVDLDYFGSEKNHKERIIAMKDNVLYEFLLTGKISKVNLLTNEISEYFLKYEPDSTEYSYHLMVCMVFPK